MLSGPKHMTSFSAKSALQTVGHDSPGTALGLLDS